MRAWAILAAAGTGDRLGAADGIPKALRTVGGAPMFAHPLRTLGSVEQVEAVVLVLAPLWLEHTLSELPAIERGDTPVELVPGGASRRASVLAGLRRVPEEIEAVVVHDAARPLAEPVLFVRVLGALVDADGAICAVPVADTLKRADADGRVAGTVPREGLWRAQTPQAFRRAALLDAHGGAEDAAVTDDAELIERAGGTVALVNGDERNIKITTAADLALAEALLAGRT